MKTSPSSLCCSHAFFKKRLVDHFRRRNEQLEQRERYMTETYARLMATWTKKVERMENSKKRREREAKARELYEKIFPELRKQREDKERDHRLGSRGAVRSEADMEDVIERLRERENEDKKMHSYAVIPPVLLPHEERQRKFTSNNGLILDPLKEFNDRKFQNMWTDPEKDLFKEKFLQHPKNFGMIAQNLERKSVSDCVQYYYLTKKSVNFKQQLRRAKVRGRRGGRGGQAAAARGGPSADIQAIQAARAAEQQRADAANAAAMDNDNSDAAMMGGVMTRRQRDGQDSNRSTPQPGGGVKQEIKQEPDDDRYGRTPNSSFCKVEFLIHE